MNNFERNWIYQHPLHFDTKSLLCYDNNTNSTLLYLRRTLFHPRTNGFFILRSFGAFAQSIIIAFVNCASNVPRIYHVPRAPTAGRLAAAAAQEETAGRVERRQQRQQSGPRGPDAGGDHAQRRRRPPREAERRADWGMCCVRRVAWLQASVVSWEFILLKSNNLIVNKNLTFWQHFYLNSFNHSTIPFLQAYAKWLSNSAYEHQLKYSLICWWEF